MRDDRSTTGNALAKTDDRSRKINAIVTARLEGVGEEEIRRLASENGWDSSIINTGLARSIKKAASLAVDLAPGSYDLPFWHRDLPEIRVRHSGPGPVSLWLGPFLQVTRRAIAALALACLALPAHAAEPCKVNVSTCGPAECALLPGVGMVTAGRISAAHPTNLAALDSVKGIGPKKSERMEPFVTFAGPTTCTEKQKGPKAVKDGAK